MANEITYSISMTCRNGSFATTFAASGNITQSVLGAAQGVATIGTAEENLAIGDVATNGLLCLRNLDATNFVDYGLDDGGTMKAIGRMKPGEPAVLRLKPATTLRLKADTAAVKVHYILLND